jgi:hypothetical protein
MRISKFHLSVALILFTGTQTTFAQNAENGRRLSERWCSECHAIGPERRRTRSSGIGGLGARILELGAGASTRLGALVCRRGGDPKSSGFTLDPVGAIMRHARNCSPENHLRRDARLRRARSLGVLLRLSLLALDSHQSMAKRRPAIPTSSPGSPAKPAAGRAQMSGRISAPKPKPRRNAYHDHRIRSP